MAKPARLWPPCWKAEMLIKFCGMREASDLEVAASLGVNLCGFIFHPKSPRYIDPRSVSNLPSFGMLRAGVFVNQSEGEIDEIARLARLDLIQLHGSQDESGAMRLGRERVIRVVWPERFPDISQLNKFLDRMKDSCAFFLLDAGQRLGSSGKTLDPLFLKGLDSPRPYFLAGGLSPENISSCLQNFKPDGLDVNSGLESSPGKKDKDKMRAFFTNLQKGV